MKKFLMIVSMVSVMIFSHSALAECHQECKGPKVCSMVSKCSSYTDAVDQNGNTTEATSVCGAPQLICECSDYKNICDGKEVSSETYLKTGWDAQKKANENIITIKSMKDVSERKKFVNSLSGEEAVITKKLANLMDLLKTADEQKKEQSAICKKNPWMQKIDPTCMSDKQKKIAEYNSMCGAATIATSLPSQKGSAILACTTMKAEIEKMK